MGLSSNCLLVNLGSLAFHENPFTNCYRTIGPRGLNFQALGRRLRVDINKSKIEKQKRTARASVRLGLSL